jgi:hypothetical protein
MKRRQSGITAIGIILILGVLACVVLFSLRIFPLYNEYMSVITSMKGTANQPKDRLKTKRDIQKAFLRAVQLNNVQRFNDKTVKDHLTIIKPKKKGEPRILNVKYESRNKLFHNIYLTMVFDESVAIGGGAE